MENISRNVAAENIDQVERAWHSNQPVPFGSKTPFSLLHGANEAWG